MKKLLCAASIAALSFLGSGVANAALLTLNFSGANFSSTGGGTLTGSFDYNTTSGTYSNWNITSTAAILGSFTYTSANSAIDLSALYTGYGVQDGNYASILKNGATLAVFRELNMHFLNSLSNLVTWGDTTSLVIGGGSRSNDSDASQNAVFSGGSVVVTAVNGVAATPIPAAAWLFGTGIAGLVGASKRKKVAAAETLAA